MANGAKKAKKTQAPSTKGAGRRVQTEVERKYDVDAEAGLPEFAGAGPIAESVREDTVRMRAEYFDTADRALSRGRITLRRREGGGDEGWHVKLPGPAGRTEIHAPLTSTSAVPASVREPVLGYVGRTRLEPLALLETERAITVVRDAAGRRLAEIADDLVVARDERTGQERSWREWEVELLDADGEDGTAVLDAVEERLLDAGARPAASASKLARATGGPVDDSTPPPGDGGEAALAAVRDLLRELRAVDPLVRLETEDAVHRMRVLTCRLRSVLAASRRVLDRASTDPIRDELRWLAGILGAARDEEVLSARVRSALEGAAEEAGLPTNALAPALFEAIERRHGVALRRVARTLRGGRYLALLASLDALLADAPRTTHASAGRKKLVHRSVEKELARVTAAGRGASDNAVASRHELRKAAKRLRYVVEAWASVAPGAVSSTHRRIRSLAEDLSDALGEERDALAARVALAAHAAEAQRRGEPGFLLGVAFAGQGRRVEEATALADEALGRLRSLSR